MRLHVHHRTEYHYSAPVSASVNEVRLQPKDTRWQQCESCLIGILPATRLTHYQDLNVNRVHHFEIPQPHRRLVIESRSTVLTRSRVDFSQLPYGYLHRQLLECRYQEGCFPFLQDSSYIERTPVLWRKALDIQDASEDVFQTSYAIMEHIFRNYQYQSGATSVTTHASEVIEKQTGVCQDFAHAMVALCRAIGIPARYVSGYFFDATRDHQLRGSGASHAWTEVYVGDAGWIGLDPTNNKVIDDTYIKIATGRDYRDVAPVVGSYYGQGESSLRVTVRVEQLPDEGTDFPVPAESRRSEEARTAAV